MNATIFAIALAIASASATTFAADTSLSTVAVHREAPVVVHCREERLPSRQSVGELLGSNNASYVSAQREVLVHIAHRECMRGADHIAFVRDDSTAPASLALADTQP